jgi:serine/threonine protein kinase
MYVIVAGKHPIYQSNDTISSYLVKLKDPQWEFPPDFSEIAKDFFLRLVKIDPNDRYTAKEALQHPWITRTPCTIPLTYYENLSYTRAKKEMVNVSL